MTDPYRPDWCQECRTHLAIPRTTSRVGVQVRLPLLCPVCLDDEKRRAG